MILVRNKSNYFEFNIDNKIQFELTEGQFHDLLDFMLNMDDKTKNEIYQEGYDAGYENGREDGYDDGYDRGYKLAKADG